MKKLFALLAVVLGLASCQKDVNSLEVNVGEQETVVTVSLPEVTRANSAESGWKNTKGTLRVILQIFDENGNTTNEMRFDDKELTYGNNTVNYNVRLVPGHKYTFVAWADQDTEGQYFNTSNLKNVTFVDGAWTAMNENIDAYTDTETVEAGNSIRSINLVLTRPFAKVRVVATDINAVRAQGWVPTTAIATYQETVPVSFNAFAGVVGETAPVANPVRHVAYNDPYDDNAGEMTLFADYLYVPTSGTAKFEFLINGVDKNGNAIAIRNDIVFNTPIPAVRNKLTTIKGNILTDGSNIKVEVEKEFEQPGNEIEVVEIPVTNATELIAALANSNAEIILQNDIDMRETTLVIDTPAETRAASTLPGRNITIDGNGKTLTSSATRAINVSGINGVTIKNLKIKASGERAINIIQNATNVTIDNVTATAANYTVNVATSAPGAVVAIKNSTLNGLCTVNVASAGANVTVDGSTVNCNDNNTTAGESYAALCLNKEAVGGKIIATNSTINVTEGSDSMAGRNGAEDGEVTINGGVEGVVVMVAVITYPGSDYYHGFQTIEDAVKFAKSKDVISLIRDVELTEPLVIAQDKNVVLDLNGKTVEGTDTITGSFGLITNKGNLTVKNGTITLKAENNRGWNAYSSVISNTVGGKLVVENGTIEHLGGTDMAYGIDNLTNGKGTYAETVINGGNIKSTYRAIRMFLNGIEADNILTVNGGTIEGANKSIWMQDPSANANTGKLVVNEGATLKGDAYLSVTAGSTEWPVEVTIADSALAGESKITSKNVPECYGVVLDENGNWVVESYTKVTDGLFKDDKGAYVVTNAEGLAKLNTMMADKSAGKNVVVNINADIDFTGKTWTPVDSHADSNFTFKELNGNGYTLSNLTINGQAMFTRFAGSDDVIIKDITFDAANVNSKGNINTSILTVQSYQNVTLDNVDVKNSTICGGYKVAPLIATVYNESSSTVTATLKNCDVKNTTVKATSLDFCTTGMVAFVKAGDNDAIKFENCTVTNVKLMAPNDSYKAHAAVYTTGSETLYNKVEGVTVTNVTFENI